MDRITKSPGLHHILQDIFMNLRYVSSIFDCASVSPVWREVLNCQTIRLKRPDISNFFQPEKSKGHEIIHIRLENSQNYDRYYGFSVFLWPHPHQTFGQKLLSPEKRDTYQISQRKPIYENLALLKQLARNSNRGIYVNEIRVPLEGLDSLKLLQRSDQIIAANEHRLNHSNCYNYFFSGCSNYKANDEATLNLVLVRWK